MYHHSVSEMGRNVSYVLKGHHSALTLRSVIATHMALSAGLRCFKLEPRCPLLRSLGPNMRRAVPTCKKLCSSYALSRGRLSCFCLEVLSWDSVQDYCMSKCRNHHAIAALS